MDQSFDPHVAIAEMRGLWPPMQEYVDGKFVNSFNVETFVTKSVDYLKQVLKSSGRSSFVIGISGGVDSLVCGKLAALAIMELNQESAGKEFFLRCINMPYGVQTDANSVIDSLKFIGCDDSRDVNIKAMTDHFMDWFFEDMNLPLTDEQVTAIGNVKARMRMTTLYFVANTQDGLVINTGNLSEWVMGFFTTNGDGAGDVMPIIGITKTQVRDVALYLGAPLALAHKVATADLDSANPLLPDEEVFRFSYQELDSVIMGHDEVTGEDYTRIAKRYWNTRFKRHVL